MDNFSGEIQWFEFCVSTPVNPEQSAKHFGELANAVQILHGYRREWTEDDIISILDELTSRHCKVDISLGLFFIYYNDRLFFLCTLM